MASSSGATLRTQLLNEAFSGNLRRFKKYAEELDDGKGVAKTVPSVRSATGLSVLHHAAMGGTLNICRYLIHDLKLDVNIRGDKKGKDHTKGMKLNTITGAIELKQVDFMYPNRPNCQVLQQFTLKVKAGRSIGLVGKSGCGKSTVISLIQRFYDVHRGLVKIDGVDIRELDIGWYRMHTALVSQEPVIYSGSIHENIVMGKTNASESEVVNAAKAGETPLLLASLGGQKSTVAYLLKMGGNPEVRDEKGLTPLHHATIQGNGELVHLLLTPGVDVDSISIMGTPLEMTASRSPEIVKILLDHHADPNYCSSRAYTPLSFAVSANTLQCVELLLEAGANPDKAGASGVTPLLIAVSEGRTEIIRCLLKYGANPDLVGEEGLKPVEIAAVCANHQCAKVLFPVTSPIPSYPDWSFVIVMKHVHSKEARAQRELKNEELFAGAKLKGDVAFHDKDYHMAILEYSRAIVADPSSAVALSNRSLCWARLKSGQAALLDALQCIMLKPDWPKGYYRAGVAWNILQNFDQAADLFFEGLKLDPDNKELEKAYQEAVEARIDTMNVNI